MTKLNADDYTTSMTGIKRADKQTWSASPAAQRRRLVKLLQEMIEELEAAPAEAPASDQPVAANATTPGRKRTATPAPTTGVGRPRLERDEPRSSLRPGPQ